MHVTIKLSLARVPITSLMIFRSMLPIIFCNGTTPCQEKELQSITLCPLPFKDFVVYVFIWRTMKFVYHLIIFY